MNRSKLTLAFLCLITVAAFAQDDEPDYLAAARQALENFQFEQCVSLVSNGLQNRDESRELDHAYTIDSLIYRSVAYYNLNDLENMKQDFAAILRLDPSWQLDSPYASAQMNQIWSETRQSIVGTLEIVTFPVETEVSVEGRQLPAGAQREIALVAGAYLVTVKAENYFPEERMAVVRAGQTTFEEFELERAAATLTLRTQPAGVSVEIGGIYRGVTVAAEGAGEDIGELLVNGLDKKDYLIKLTRDCYSEMLSQISIQKYGDFVISEPFRLERNQAYVEVPELPAYSRVIINGKTVANSGKIPVDICGESLEIEYRSLYGGARIFIENPEADAVYGQATLHPVVIHGPAFNVTKRALENVEYPDDVIRSKVLNSEPSAAISLRVVALIETILPELGDQRFIELNRSQFDVVQNLLSEEGSFFFAMPLERESRRGLLIFNALYPFAEFHGSKDFMNPPRPEIGFARYHGLRFLHSPFAGAWRVSAVEPGSPAENAGIRKGHQLLRFAGGSPEWKEAAQSWLPEDADENLPVQFKDQSGTYDVVIKTRNVPVRYLPADVCKDSLPVSYRLATLLLARELTPDQEFTALFEMEKARLLLEAGMQREGLAALENLLKTPGIPRYRADMIKYILMSNEADGTLADIASESEAVGAKVLLPDGLPAGLLVRLINDEVAKRKDEN